MLHTLPSAPPNASSTPKTPKQDPAKDQEGKRLSIVQGPSAREHDWHNGVPKQHHDQPKDRNGHQDQNAAPHPSSLESHNGIPHNSNSS
jgi:hypothetical protein